MRFRCRPPNTQGLDNAATLRSTVEEKYSEHDSVVLNRRLPMPFESAADMEDSVRRLFSQEVAKRQQNMEDRQSRQLFKPTKKTYALRVSA